MTSLTEQQKQTAWKRLGESAKHATSHSARGVLYVAAIASVTALFPHDPAQIAQMIPASSALIGAMGGDVLVSLLEKVANAHDPTPEQILALVQSTLDAQQITEAKLDTLLTVPEFYQGLSLVRMQLYEYSTAMKQQLDEGSTDVKQQLDEHFTDLNQQLDEIAQTLSRLAGPVTTSSQTMGFSFGDISAQQNVTIAIKDSAGGHQVKDSQYFEHVENLHLHIDGPQKPGFSGKPGFSRLQLPLDHIPPAASLPPGSWLPMGLNPHFVGRERELQQLAQVLQTGDTAAIGQMATITGLGGVGKSQLAIAFAHHYGPLFAGGVFWVNMSAGANVPAELAKCGIAMPLGDGYAGLSLEEQVQRVQRAWQEPIPRLLLFDNCEEESLLAQWRPTTGGCRVLATSRRAVWDSSLGVATLALDTLTPPESRALLQSLTPHLRDDDADAIAEELGHLPLALHLAGSYLHTYHHAPFAQPTAYLSELQTERLEHPSLQGEGSSHSPTAHERHVGRTFALSLERLNPDEPVDQLALSLLVCAACFAPGSAIPRPLLLTSAGITSDNRADQLRGEKAMAQLVGLGLLTVEATTGWPVIHRLVAAFVQAQKVDEKAQAQVEKTVQSEAQRLNNAGYP